MKKTNIMKSARYAALAMAGLAAGSLAPNANALTILVFGQQGDADTIFATNPTANTTRITATNALVDITNIACCGGSVSPAYFNMVLDSIGAATLVAGNILQEFSGYFSFSSGANGTGTNYLYSQFDSAVFGSGALTINASTPGNAISFTSDVITILGLPRQVTFSFTNIDPQASLCPINGDRAGQTICAFSSNSSGNMSANPEIVPEPGSLALLGLGLIGLGAARRRRAA